MLTAPDPDVVILSDGAPNLYEGAWPDRILSQVTRAEIHAYPVVSPKARVLVCPGGGYVKIMHDREGVDLALWLNSLGYDAYVLVYRLPGALAPHGVWDKDIALADALRGLAAIPRDLPLLVAGLSSGGHLAGAVVCQPGVQASGLLAAYAPLNANHSEHKAPAGKPDYPPPEKQAFYDDWPIGLAAHPHGLPPCPVFLAYALHDSPVPIEHALNFIQAARDVGLALDAHIFGRAPHGFALRDLDGEHGIWPQLAAGWIAQRLA